MIPISSSTAEKPSPRDELSDLRRLNWALAAYARSTTVLVHTGDVQEVIAKVCDAIVTQSPYVLAAVGIPETGAGKPLRIAGCAGPATAYFDGLHLSWSEERPEGRGASGLAIRTGRPVIIRDSHKDPIFAPWLERAKRFGIRSSVTVPFGRGGVVTGYLIVYAGETDAFGADELALFERLGDELAFGLSLAADRARLAEAEDARRSSEARYQRLFDAAANGILVADREGRFLDVNPAFCRMTGYDAAALVGRHVSLVVAPEEAHFIKPAIAEAIATAEHRRSWRCRRRDGSTFPADVTATTMPDGNLLAIVRDVSEQAEAEAARSAAEQALRKSEARYRSLFDNAPEGLVMISQEGPYLDVNPSACRMLRYRREDLIGKTGRDLVDEAQAPFLTEAAQEIARHGVTRRRWRLKRADDTWVAAEVVSTQLPDGPYMSVITDLTDRDAIEAARTAAETRLRESEARYRGLFENAPDGIIVNSEAGPYIDINPSACEMLGYSREEFIGLRVVDLVGEDQSQIHLNALQALGSEGKFRAAWRAKRKDGSWVPTEVVTTQMPDRTYISIIRDVTERNAIEAARASTEAELRTSEARYRGLFDHAPDGIIVIAEDGEYIDINPSACDMLGYRREDFIGLRGPDLIGEEQVPMLAKTLEAIAADGVFRAAWRLKRKDGSWVPTEAVTTQMPDKTYVSIIRDVTERELAEAARQAAEDMLRETQARLAQAGRVAALGEVMATISHEINQPLAAIITNSDAARRWLNRAPPNLGAVQDSLDNIARDSRRAGQVIRRTRDFLAGRGSERRVFDLNSTLEEVVTLSRTERRRAGVVTRMEFDPDLPRVEADPIQIQQVALNLILNALDAMSATEDALRRLTLTTSRLDGDWAVVAVEDRGPGLDPATADHLFDQFFTTKTEGTGVGLSISRSLVESHGGRIWAETSQNGGAVFRFTVPLAREETS